MQDYVMCKPTSNNILNLICFHFAGGSKSFFEPFKRMIPEDWQLVTIQLPGRENSMHLPFFETIEQAVSEIFKELKGYLNQPSIFFGYSLGGLLCFEMLRFLRRSLIKLPIHTFIAATQAPQLHKYNKVLNPNASNQDLKDILRNIQGTPEEILNHNETFNFIIPRIRADFKLSQSYKYYDERPISTNLTILSGKEDPLVNYKKLPDWSIHTNKQFKIKMFTGGHFFIEKHLKNVINIMVNHVKQIHN